MLVRVGFESSIEEYVALQPPNTVFTRKEPIGGGYIVSTAHYTQVEVPIGSGKALFCEGHGDVRRPAEEMCLTLRYTPG